MNAQIQIARNLKIEASAIVRCEEWVNVWFVVVSGLGARFVSKKAVNNMKLEKYASYPEAAQYLKKIGVWGDALENTSIWGVLKAWINSPAREWKASSLQEAIREVNAELQALGLAEYTQVRELIGGPVAFRLTVNGFDFTFFSF